MQTGLPCKGNEKLTAARAACVTLFRSVGNATCTTKIISTFGCCQVQLPTIPSAEHAPERVNLSQLLPLCVRLPNSSIVCPHHHHHHQHLAVVAMHHQPPALMDLDLQNAAQPQFAELEAPLPRHRTRWWPSQLACTRAHIQPRPWPSQLH